MSGEWRPKRRRSNVADLVAHCLEGKSLLLSGMPGTGKTHLAKRLVTELSQLGEGVTLISKTHCSVQNLGIRSADGGPLGAAHDPCGPLLPGLAGRGRSHAARRRAVGRHRGALHEPSSEIPAAGRFQAAASGAGRLRGAPEPQGVPAAPRPGRRLRARAHGEPTERRGDLFLSGVAEGGRERAGGAAGRRAAGPGALPEAGAPRHLPGDLARAQDRHQRP